MASLVWEDTEARQKRRGGRKRGVKLLNLIRLRKKITGS
jgi:hypothetical protein